MPLEGRVLKNEFAFFGEQIYVRELQVSMVLQLSLRLFLYRAKGVINFQPICKVVVLDGVCNVTLPEETNSLEFVGVEEKSFVVLFLLKSNVAVIYRLLVPT